MLITGVLWLWAPERMCRPWLSRRCGVLVRSAQSENPERFVLVDIDGDEASWGAVLLVRWPRVSPSWRCARRGVCSAVGACGLLVSWRLPPGVPSGVWTRVRRARLRISRSCRP